MEELIVSLVIAAIDGVPKIIEAVKNSNSLSADQKAKLLNDLNIRLTAGAAKVAAVTFKDV